MNVNEMQAGDEIDWLIFRYVSNPNEYIDELQWERRKALSDDWKGTSSNLELAWVRVVEKLKLRGLVRVIAWQNGMYEATIGNNIAIAQTAALSICRVGLMEMNATS